jgi:signal transduction histidine kinase
MAKRLLVWLLLTAPWCVRAQTRTADSLKNILSKSQGETRLTVLNKLSYELIGHDNVAADQYADEAIRLGEQIKNEKLAGIAYSQRGVNAYLSGYYPKALFNLKKGLSLAQASGDRSNQGYTLLQLGNCYMDKGVFDSSKHYYDKAYLILKDSANPRNLSKLYRNLSVMYRFLGDNQKQKKYLGRALKINYAMRDEERIVDVLVLQAVLLARQAKYDSANAMLDMTEKKARQMKGSPNWIYEINYNRALLAIAQSNYDKAFRYMDSARNYLDAHQVLKKKVVFLKNIGRAFSIQGDYELALQNLYEALAIAEREDYFNDALEILCELGWVTHHIGDPAKSLMFAEKALKNSTEVNSPIYMVQALNLKGIVLLDLNRFDEGIKVLRANMDTCRKYHDYIGLIEAHLNLGDLEIKAKHASQAVPLLTTAIAMSKEKLYAHGELWGHLSLARATMELKLLPRAVEELALGEKLEKIMPEKEAIVQIYDLKKALYKAQGNFQLSLHFAELAEHLKDSIRSKELTNRFANLQRLDEIRQRERNIQSLMQQRELSEAQLKLKDSRLQLQYILVAVAVLGILTLLLTTFRFRGFYKKIVLLNKGIQERNEEIQAQSEELIQSNRTIHELNEHLNKMVEEKTSNLKKTNEELIRSNNNLQQFSYVVSHNLRGPIARLLGLTSLLKTLPPGEEQEKFIELTHQSGTDLDNIVTDLSKIINLKGGMNSLELVDLKAEFDIAMQQNAIPENYRACVSANFEEQAKVRSVKAFVQSIFYNLLSNAYKYRSPDRALQIDVKVKKIDNAMEISIRDNGLGIDLTKYRDSVFKLFKRFHLNADGRGLGLYLVKEQVEALGGTIDIQSQPDVGTTFIIRHPL